MSLDPKRELLRHTLATLAYRGAKAVRDAPESFANFKESDTARTPLQILTHISDLLDWAYSMAQGTEVWNNARPGSWSEEIDRFHRALAQHPCPIFLVNHPRQRDLEQQDLFDSFIERFDLTVLSQGMRIFAGPRSG